MKNIVKSNYSQLFGNISLLLEEARRKTVRQINTVMVETYYRRDSSLCSE
ncbi:MAG: hypothetical protein HY919_08345 [Elusimicrobia bacterium]|nr:hypothetical protein [Elusimicrobiota bacterium]